MADAVTSEAPTRTHPTHADSALLSMMQPSTSASSPLASAPAQVVAVAPELTAPALGEAAVFLCDARDAAAGCTEPTAAEAAEEAKRAAPAPRRPPGAPPPRTGHHTRPHTAAAVTPPPPSAAAAAAASAVTPSHEDTARAVCAFADRLRHTIQRTRADVPPMHGSLDPQLCDASTSESSCDGDAAAAPHTSGSGGGVTAKDGAATRGSVLSADTAPLPHASGIPLMCPQFRPRTSANLSAGDSAAHGPVSAYNIDIFNVSSLAQYTLNRSVASITTRPPTASSHELTRRKSKGAYYINNYRMIKTLGRGACGKVKLAFDNAECRLVAIKNVRRADTRKRIGGLTLAQQHFKAFLREVDIMKKLRHRNIVSLYEVIDDPNADKLYLVMQYVEKGVIAQVQVRAGSDCVCEPVPPAQLARYTREMLAGLQYLHRHDVVHRDIKPDNILVSSDDHAFLADFGVAEAFDTSFRQRIEAMMAQSMAMSVAGGRNGGPQVLGTKGTPLFIAPELWNGAKSYGKPVDMWAMGVTLYTLLVGKLPFRCPEDITNESITPVVPAKFDPEWHTLVAGLLHRNPQVRWTVEKARGYVKLVLVPMYPQSAANNSAAGAPCGSTSGGRQRSEHGGGTRRHSYEDEGSSSGGSSTTDDGATHPCTAGAALEATQRARTSTTAAAGGEDADKDSFSRMESQVLNVDFLPMPDRLDAKLATPLEQTLAPGPLDELPGLECKVSAAAVAEADDDGVSRVCLSSGGTSLRTTPIVRRQLPLSPTHTQVPTSLTTTTAAGKKAEALGAPPSVLLGQPAVMPLPPAIALQQLPVMQAVDNAQPRGRRPCQRNATISKSASRGRSFHAAALQAVNTAAAAAAVLTAQRNDLHRQVSQQTHLADALASPVTPMPPSTPVFATACAEFIVPAGNAGEANHANREESSGGRASADPTGECAGAPKNSAALFDLCHITLSPGAGVAAAAGTAAGGEPAALAASPGIQSGANANTSAPCMNPVT